MKFIDRAFAITVAAFALGSVTGAVAVFALPPLNTFVGTLLTVRLLGPVREASMFGSIALALLIFGNNSITVLLSFLYPFILGKVSWTPAPSLGTMNRLLAWFSGLAGFLIGFFDLGATLGWAWEKGGGLWVYRLLARSWLHGPLEFLFVLLAVAEPLRLTKMKDRRISLVDAVKEDWKLFCICLLGLLASAMIEVFVLA
jgi:hypothetical protein